MIKKRIIYVHMVIAILYNRHIGKKKLMKLL